jgi:hypothetical protein
MTETVIPTVIPTVTPTIVPDITPYPYLSSSPDITNIIVVISVAVVGVFFVGIAIRQLYYFINSIFK